MVARGLTADVFIQLTATLAHLSNMQKNASTIGPPMVAPLETSSGYTTTLSSIGPDLDSLPMKSIERSGGWNVTIPCREASLESFILTLEWWCRGCHSLGTTDDTKMAVYSSEHGAQALIHPSRISLSGMNHNLVINPVETGDTGDLYCLVNGRTTPTQVIKLTVKDVPSVPGKPLIMAFTSRSVNLSWAPPLDNNNSPIQQYIIMARQGEDTSWGDSNMVETQTNSTVFTVSGLHPFTVYSFKVIAVNGMGRSLESKESYYMITLREVPSGKPTITAAHNASSTAIQLSWRPPHPSTIHGEFLGYRIVYKPRDTTSEQTTEITVKDPTTTKYTIQKLSIFTQYLVSLQVVNPEGLGPSTTVVVMTDEGVPSHPENVTTGSPTNTSVVVRWMEPSHPNGIIEGYRLYFMHKNFTDVRTIREPAEKMEFFLSGLEPFTKYKLWLKAFTWKNEGEPSDPFEVITDVAGPSSVLITNLTCQDERTLFLQWSRPSVIYNGVDNYYVYYRNEENWLFEEVSVTSSFDETSSKMLLPNLTSNTMYEIKVRGATKSLYNQTKLYKGQFSETHKILLQLNCDQIQAFTMIRSEQMALNLNAGVIAVLACVVFAVVLVILALVLWRRFFSESYYYLEETASNTNSASIPDWDCESTKGEKTSIPAHLFIQHVANLHADGDIGFSKEYENIQAYANGDELHADQSTHPENKSKNRYHNVVAYDHSRVQLKPLPGQKKGEYVNANYIDGFQKSRAYIGTQGPLPGTFHTFWRMIWEQKVHVIVMITNLIERGRRKCDMYWPKEGSEIHGLIEVALEREDVMATYTVRTFRISHTKIKKSKGETGERRVYQYHYTNWPDHGTPDNPLPVLSFVKKSSLANKETDGPIVVHCSAGVGRTGAYILIDAMLKQMRAKGELNIVAFLSHIRKQRNYLVQTEEQYIFVHDALSEAVASGETNINRSYLSRYINSLQSSFTTDEHSVPWQLLDRQFKLATAQQPNEGQFTAAIQPCNQIKNQNFDFLPIEIARVSLNPKSGIEGSDYINASWLPGFSRLREFIITQHPKEQTTIDFWRLIWDHNVQTIVVLSPLQEPDFSVFWPTKYQDIDLDSIRVKFTEEGLLGGFQTKDFALLSLQDDYELTVRMVFCPAWTSECSNTTSSLPTNFLHVIHERQEGLTHSPIVCIDSYGGTAAATFAALSTLLKQVDYDSHVDVYQVVKILHNCRPGIWKNPEDILFLYKALESYVVSTGGGKKQSQSNGGLPNTEFSGVSNGHAFDTGRVPPDGMEASHVTIDMVRRY